MQRLATLAAMVGMALAGSMLSAVSPAAAETPTLGPFFIFTAWVEPTAPSDKCVDVPHGNYANNQQVQTYQCHTGSPNQRWLQDSEGMGLVLDPYVSSDGVRHWRSRNVYNFRTYDNECLTVLNNRTDNNAPVILYNCNTGANEEWATVKAYLGDGPLYLQFYWIVNLHSQKCLTVQNPTAGGGAGNLIQYDCNIGFNEEWTWWGWQ